MSFTVVFTQGENFPLRTTFLILPETYNFSQKPIISFKKSSNYYQRLCHAPWFNCCCKCNGSADSAWSSFVGRSIQNRGHQRLIGIQCPVCCFCVKYGPMFGVWNVEIQHLNIHIKILKDLLRDSEQKAMNLYEENKRLNNLVESYANNLKVRLTEIEKTTKHLQEQTRSLDVD